MSNTAANYTAEELNSPVYDLPAHKIEMGSPLAELIQEAGYTESARTVINERSAWSLKLAKLIGQLESEVAELAADAE